MTHSVFGAELLAIRAGMHSPTGRNLPELMDEVSQRAGTFTARVKADAAEALDHYPWILASNLIDVLCGFLLDVEKEVASLLEEFRAEATTPRNEISYAVDDFYVDLATAMRDARWELMVLRAERRPEEEASATTSLPDDAASLDRPG